MAVTIRDVAAQAGVSHMTVSRALSGSSALSPQTRERVLHAIHKAGYLPNANARSLSRGKVEALGLLVGTDGPKSVYSQILPGIQAALRRRNLHLTLAELPDQKLTDAGFVPRILKEFSVSGFLIGYTHGFPERMRTLIEKHRVPSVWMNANFQKNAVYPNDREAARRVTQHLIERGHRRIAYLTFQTNAHYSHPLRYGGYLEALQGAGLSPIDGRSKGYLVRSDLCDHVVRLLKHPAKPTAVVAYEAPEARAIALAAARLGLRIPEDLSLVVMTSPVMEILGLDVTCVTVPFTEVGQEATHMLLRRIDGGAEQPSVAVNGEFIAGGTVAPPKAE